jgi:hypothetical protein
MNTTNPMTNEETDAALILENELKRRVNEVVERVVINIVGKVIHEELNKYKSEMMLEVALSVGKMLRVVENEGRKPLWESTPEEFGLTHEELNTHSIEKVTHAVREQT